MSTSVSALRVVPLFLSLAAISCFSLASSVKLGSFSAGTEINNSVGCFLSVFSPVTLSVWTASTVGVFGLTVSI